MSTRINGEPLELLPPSGTFLLVASPTAVSSTSSWTSKQGIQEKSLCTKSMTLKIASSCNPKRCILGENPRRRKTQGGQIAALREKTLASFRGLQASAGGLCRSKG
ncbi:hypothetical protein FOVG_18646 [Fusarium oxysporum f. sp. pisi HDV247]|uniref:Uncharacterized protein n=1 Tax=Fusarium oxysporum f. sp. pisi HDV247 TaxID=1080344 RepID=W9NGS7_FUSOX|nr:hypothetical protein FOVG_18646 [Fusarium oxysporum f. sp. pisi HDV247]